MMLYRILRKISPFKWKARCGHRTNRFIKSTNGYVFWQNRFREEVPFCEKCYQNADALCGECQKTITLGSRCSYDHKKASKPILPVYVNGLFGGGYDEEGEASILCCDCGGYDPMSPARYSIVGEWKKGIAIFVI